MGSFDADMRRARGASGERFDGHKAAGGDDFSDFIEIADGEQSDVGIYFVFAQRSEVVGHDALVAVPARTRRTSHAHGHEIEGEISSGDAVNEDEAEELLEIGRHLVGKVEKPMAKIKMTLAVERRMGGHEAEAHHPRAEEARTVMSQYFLSVVLRNVVYIAVDGIDVCGLQRVGDLSEDGVGGIKIVAVENAHNIAFGHLQTFVHGIVESAVFFADKTQFSRKTPGIVLNNLHGVVGGKAVDNDDFIIIVGL